MCPEELRPVRPLLVAPYGEYGGSEMVILRVVAELGDDIRPEALLLGSGRFAELLAAAGVPTQVEDLPGKKGLLGFPKALRAAAARYRSRDISLVHANGTKADTLDLL